jgi:hypothetical protein
MTIVPFLRDNVSGLREVEAMSTTLEDICKILNVADRPKALLRDLTLEIVSGRGEWPAAPVRAAQRGAL